MASTTLGLTLLSLCLSSVNMQSISGSAHVNSSQIRPITVAAGVEVGSREGGHK